MPKNNMEKTALAPDGKDLDIHISFAKNGVTVRANCMYDSGKVDSPMKHKSEEYVYKSLEEALKEIPSIVSVLNEVKKEKISKQDKMNEPDMTKG